MKWKIVKFGLTLKMTVSFVTWKVWMPSQIGQRKPELSLAPKDVQVNSTETHPLWLNYPFVFNKVLFIKSFFFLKILFIRVISRHFTEYCYRCHNITRFLIFLWWLTGSILIPDVSDVLVCPGDLSSSDVHRVQRHLDLLTSSPVFWIRN